MKKRRVILAFVLLLLILGISGIIFITFFPSRIIKSQIENTVPGLKVKSVHLTSNSLIIDDPIIKNGEAFFQAQKVQIHFSGVVSSVSKYLKSKKFDLDRVEIQGFQVALIREKNGKFVLPIPPTSKASDSKAESSSSVQLHIGRVVLTGGRIALMDKLVGANTHLNGINAQIIQINYPFSGKSTFNLSGRLGRGEISLNGSVFLKTFSGQGVISFSGINLLLFQKYISFYSPLNLKATGLAIGRVTFSFKGKTIRFKGKTTFSKVKVLSKGISSSIREATLDFKSQTSSRGFILKKGYLLLSGATIDKTSSPRLVLEYLNSRLGLKNLVYPFSSSKTHFDLAISGPNVTHSSASGWFNPKAQDGRVKFRVENLDVTIFQDFYAPVCIRKGQLTLDGKTLIYSGRLDGSLLVDAKNFDFCSGGSFLGFSVGVLSGLFESKVRGAKNHVIIPNIRITGTLEKPVIDYQSAISQEISKEASQRLHIPEHLEKVLKEILKRK